MIGSASSHVIGVPRVAACQNIYTKQDWWQDFSVQTAITEGSSDLTTKTRAIGQSVRKVIPEKAAAVKLEFVHSDAKQDLGCYSLWQSLRMTCTVSSDLQVVLRGSLG
jgi:hypothetical protein